MTCYDSCIMSVVMTKFNTITVFNVMTMFNMMIIFIDLMMDDMILDDNK